MKISLVSLSALVALSVTSTAQAFSPTDLSLSLADAAVAAELADSQILSITEGRSYRCRGCFGITITSEKYGFPGERKHHLQGHNFDGSFHVEIRLEN